MERTKSYIFTTDPQLNVILQELIDYGSSFLINRAMDMAITTLLSGDFNPRLHDDIVKVIKDANVLALTENSLEEIVETVVELITHLFNRYYRSF